MVTAGVALVGGLAASARTEPRLTRDADLAVLVSDDRDAEVLVGHLQAPGWGVAAAIEQNVAGKVLDRDDRTRPQDRVDPAALLARADADALAEARAGLVLVPNGDAICPPGWTPP
jgi:hypothetical protein